MVRTQCYSQGQGQGQGMDISLLFFFPCVKVANTFVLPSWPWVSQDTKGGSQDTCRQHWTSVIFLAWCSHDRPSTNEFNIRNYLGSIWVLTNYKRYSYQLISFNTYSQSTVWSLARLLVISHYIHLLGRSFYTLVSGIARHQCARPHPPGKNITITYNNLPNELIDLVLI